MRISFSPQRSDDSLTFEKTAGDQLNINGELVDLSELNDGDVISKMDAKKHLSDWIDGPIEKIDGEVRVTVLLPYRISRMSVETPPSVTVTLAGPISLPLLDPDPNHEEA